MSADAKVWKDEGGWFGFHDNDDDCPINAHEGTAYDLVRVLQSIEQCLGSPLDWEIRQFGNGLGLDGRRARSGQ